MHLLHFPPARDTRITGQVTVHPTAVIASGVLLQADSESELVIGAGVCIGMGSVIHAQGGRLVIGDGVNLGAVVLIVGVGTIGDQSCVGTAATLFHPRLETGTVVPPGVLVAQDLVPVLVLEPTVPPVTPEPTAPPVTPIPTPEPSPVVPPVMETTIPIDSLPPTIPKPPPGHVIGEVFLSQLRMTLFPYRDGLGSQGE
jgi:carbon dioxide concentrating mechanism protein CcmN